MTPGFYYLCRENKGTYQLRGSASLFLHVQKSDFCHEVAHINFTFCFQSSYTTDSYYTQHINSTWCQYSSQHSACSFSVLVTVSMANDGLGDKLLGTKYAGEIRFSCIPDTKEGGFYGTP